MRAVPALVCVAAFGCDLHFDGAAPPLDDGGWRLSVSTSNYYTTGFGAWFEISPDGAARGHDWGPGYLCDGPLTPSEMMGLTDALNAASALGRGDHYCDHCADQGVYTFTVEGISGPATGRTNTFRYDSVDGGIESVNEVIAGLSDSFARLSDRGLCAGCPIEIGAERCYEAEPGVDRFCRGQAWQECVTEDVVVHCSERPSLECVVGSGWVPAIRWALVSATLTRHQASTEDPYPRVWVSWRLAIDNRSATYVAPWDAIPFVQFQLTTGEVVRADAMSAGGDPAEGAPPGSSGTYDAFSSYAAEGPLWSAPALQVRVRERPWGGATWLAPIPVTISYD